MIGNCKISERDSLFAEIVSLMYSTYGRKNKDYGDSFKQSIDEHGMIAAVVRIGDKYNRFKNLIDKEPEVVDEKLEDTLLDLANYAVMALLEVRIRTRRENED